VTGPVLRLAPTGAEAGTPGPSSAVDEDVRADTADQDANAPERAAATRLLLESLERLPVQQSAALYVVQVSDDPRSSARDVGLGIAGDPVLTARVLKLANSAYYGLSGRVSHPDFAVTLLGRDTVRAIAAAAAAGVVGNAVLPPGFWSYSGATAAAAALVAPKVGANRSEAFCLGLLHDLGAALLHQIDPARRTAIVDAAATTGVHPVHAEVPAYGLGHAEAAQRVLAAWRFPVELADAVGAHHRHSRDAMTPLERTLQAAKALVRDLPTVPRHEVPDDVDGALRAGRVTAKEEASLRQQALEQAGQLAAALSEGGAG
jgi:HD-like signal output (HDOD) protein